MGGAEGTAAGAEGAATSKALANGGQEHAALFQAHSAAGSKTSESHIHDDDDESLPPGLEDVPTGQNEAPAYTRLHMEAWIALRDRQTNPVKRWLGLVEDPHGVGSSSLVHPMSSFNHWLQLVSAIFVLYTGLVTPAVLAFENEGSSCSYLPFTVYADLVVETFFICEIGCHLITGTFNHKGVYVDSVKHVTMMYIRAPFLESFLFDVITSLPFSWFELGLWVENCKVQGAVVSDWTQQLKAPVRILRPLRLLRLFRFVKVMRVWSDHGMAVPLRVQKLIGLLGSLFFVIHIFACSYWYLKSQTQSEEQLEYFLAKFDLEAGTVQPWEKWVVSGYFINTIFRSLPDLQPERRQMIWAGERWASGCQMRERVLESRQRHAEGRGSEKIQQQERGLRRRRRERRCICISGA